MAIDKAIYVPLFTELSTGVESPFFYVAPGEVVQVMAFDFVQNKARENNEREVPLVACLEQVLFKETVKIQSYDGKRGTTANRIMSLKDYATDVLAIETVQHNGCGFTLSSCNNLMLINIPGNYRFVLNDMTALGTARIYLRVFTKDEFPWNSKFMIGE